MIYNIIIQCLYNIFIYICWHLTCFETLLLEFIGSVRRFEGFAPGANLQGWLRLSQHTSNRKLCSLSLDTLSMCWHMQLWLWRAATCCGFDQEWQHAMWNLNGLNWMNYLIAVLHFFGVGICSNARLGMYHDESHSEEDGKSWGNPAPFHWRTCSGLACFFR